MRLTRTGKPDNFYYYVIEDYKNDKGQKKTRTVESLGCARVIREKFGVDDAEQWCREYIAKKNNEIKEFKYNFPNCIAHPSSYSTLFFFGRPLFFFGAF